MLRRSALALFALIVAGPFPTRAGENEETSYFLIGNSLTWDTVPSALEGDVQWHVDCGKSLPFIHDNPNEPCVKTSTSWPAALEAKQYDVISVQPHYGSTLAEDVAVISKWVAQQRNAVFVIHSGWARHAMREEEYGRREISGKLQHSPAYFAALVAELRRRHPGREFRETRAIELLERISKDVDAGRAPFESVADLHRDAIHMRLDTGRYLMHNAMRHALGQPRSRTGFEKLDAETKRYLDSVLDSLE